MTKQTMTWARVTEVYHEVLRETGCIHRAAGAAGYLASKHADALPLGPEEKRTLGWLRGLNGDPSAIGRCAPKGDRVLNRLREKGLVGRRGIRTWAITDGDVGAFGKSPGWRPRSGTWAYFFLTPLGQKVSPAER